MNAFQRILDLLDVQQINDDLYPLLWEMKLQESEVIVRVVRKDYNIFITFISPTISTQI